ncbi:hypothetical protein BH09SUM1_BH09SUM1_29870 [soil metagenome]
MAVNGEGAANGGPAGDLITPPTEARKRPILEPGQVLSNNYEIVEQIGEGGMAVVYKARQRSLNRMVAIKAMHQRFAQDPEFIERFEAESGALAALTHPNIVSIIDRGADNKVYYFVMEYVDGQNLDQKIIENKVTPNEWRQVIAACGSALEYVHKHGIVHRDIKPSNVLIDSEGRVKIGDFGIAHIMAGDSGVVQAQGSTRPLGTAHYMAPEQTNDSGSVDHRADIFSLGVAFYKMMARRLPVGEYATPSAVNREVPIAVDAILARAMNPDRAERYQSVKEFTDDLLKALKETSVNLASVMNYRSASGGSALYSGADFGKAATTPTGAPGDKKPKPDTAAARKAASEKPTTAHGRRTPTGPLPEGGRVSVSKDMVALPIEGTKEIEPAPEAIKKTLPIKTILGAILIISILVTVGAVLFNNRAKTAATAPIPELAIKSPALEREERAKAELERHQREIMTGQPEQTQPQPTNGAPAKP